MSHHDLHTDNDHKIQSALIDATPVPEPETYVLMLAGLAAIGLVGLRRANR